MSICVTTQNIFKTETLGKAKHRTKGTKGEREKGTKNTQQAAPVHVASRITTDFALDRFCLQHLSLPPLTATRWRFLPENMRS
jgi:hypothetical protein